LPPVVVFQRLNSGVSVFALMAIPFFIYAGDLMVRGDIARRLVALAGGLVGHFKRRARPGQHPLASVMFGGISGSAAADASAIGGLMVPQMKERGYGVDYAVNITVTSAIIALMLPPSHNMIIYSIAAGGRISIADLFTAGIIPGLILARVADGRRLAGGQEGAATRPRRFPAAEDARRDVRLAGAGADPDRHHLRRRALGHLHRVGKLQHRRGLCAVRDLPRLPHAELAELRRTPPRRRCAPRPWC
jgi:tripartite ATP-independent transporter DctM subunit